MLDRERADFYRVLGCAAGAALRPLRRDPAPDRLRARADRRRRPAAQLRLHGPGAARARATRSRSRPSWRSTVAEYREKLLDAVVETDEALMERYLGGEELPPDDIAARSRTPSRTTRSTRSRAASRRRTSARTRCSTCSSRACRARRGSARRSRPTRTSPRSSSRPSPIRSPAASRVFRVYAGDGQGRHDARQPPRPFEGAARLADGAAGQGPRARRRLRRRATSAPSRS